MSGRQLAGTVAALTIPVALAVQVVLAAGDTPPATATPEPPHDGAIDPGFIVRAGADIDPGFVVDWEDRSNDTGFLVISGGPNPEPAPSPTPAPETPPAIMFGTP